MQLKANEIVTSAGAKIQFDKNSETGLYIYNIPPRPNGTIEIPIDCVLDFSWYGSYLLISHEGLYRFSLSTTSGTLDSNDLNGSYDSTNKILTISKKTGTFATNQTVTVIGNGYKFT